MDDIDRYNIWIITAIVLAPVIILILIGLIIIYFRRIYCFSKISDKESQNGKTFILNNILQIYIIFDLLTHNFQN